MSSKAATPTTPSRAGFWSHLSPSKKESKKEQKRKVPSNKETNSTTTPTKLDYSDNTTTPKEEKKMEIASPVPAMEETAMEESFESSNNEDNNCPVMEVDSLDMVSPIKRTNTPTPKKLALDNTMMTTSTTGTTSFTISEEDDEEEKKEEELITVKHDSSFMPQEEEEEEVKLDDATLQHVRTLLQSCDCRDFDKVLSNVKHLVPSLQEESIADLRVRAQQEMATRQLVQLCPDQATKVQALNSAAIDSKWLVQPWYKQVFAFPSTALWSVYDFFHARTENVRLVGYLRIAYAALFLYSRGLFAYDIVFLLDPHTGVLPYRSTQYTVDDDDYSLFALFPQSREVLYGLMALGLCNGILLLLGVAPRLQALGIFFFYYQFGNHNSILSDNQDVMMRMYALMLAMAPLDNITIWDGFGRSSSKKTTSSWPMWPFRCWQILVCLVYVGAGYGKLSSDVWRSGEALYYPPYEEGFGRFWNPDFIFNRMGPIKLLTWSTLALECLCMFAIWPKATRKFTFFSLVGLHLGIELTMIMHIFQYISVLGWCSFFVHPTTQSRQAAQPQRKRRVIGNWKRKLLETAVPVFLMYAFVTNTLPTSRILSVLPQSQYKLKRWFRRNVHNNVINARNQLYPFLKVTGLHMGEWTLFSGVPTHENHRYTALIRFQNQSEPVIWQSPDWTASSWLERELMLWSDSYYYYIWNNNDAVSSFPILTTFMEHLARTYSAEGAIEYEGAKDDKLQGERLKIHSNNTIASISLVMHQETGQGPPRPDLDWWTQPARLSTVKHSECLYYWKFPKRRNKIQYKYMSYEYDEEDDLDAQTGCWKYNATDTEYHMVG
eukprot:CAMPEP_0194231924 /NCGR_PEP_ID=MMETSP0158-20130606/483_1 /TAXON_ID=33649 /ORGANISM="Thalassionema nitzschioides, Strain L26-B" /LENGTH=832 /DNA_ID=CAMNT_0038964615 /DNA_START=37 /DNA_END=2532 /DNA_ORIENTATION=+